MTHGPAIVPFRKRAVKRTENPELRQTTIAIRQSAIKVPDCEKIEAILHQRVAFVDSSAGSLSRHSSAFAS